MDGGADLEYKKRETEGGGGGDGEDNTDSPMESNGERGSESAQKEKRGT
jgi:hypothetical protein